MLLFLIIIIIFSICFILTFIFASIHYLNQKQEAPFFQFFKLLLS